MSTLTYLDACPSCPPGLPDAAPSISDPEQVPGGTATNHQCPSCGTAWSALRSRGWVVDRITAPVSGDGAAEWPARRAAA